jgi:S1-C subfamily serine protease
VRRFVPTIFQRSPRGTIAIAILAPLALAILYIWLNSRPAPVSELEQATVQIQRVDAEGKQLTLGSGTIIGEDGLILTNAHVADPTAPGLPRIYERREVKAWDHIVVALFAGDEDKPAEPTYRARVVASDGYLDAAVLQIDQTLRGESVEPASLELQTVTLGDSDGLGIEDDIRVYGYPEVGGGSVGTINAARGQVSGFQTDPLLEGRAWIKTDASILAGNSGGLAANDRGQLIGIPSAIRSDATGTLGKIRPINLLKPLITKAKAGEEWESPYLVKGKEEATATALGWYQTTTVEEEATETTEKDKDSCTRDTEKPPRFTSGATNLVAVFSFRNMTGMEEVQSHWLYQANPGDTPKQVITVAREWNPKFGTSHECFWMLGPKALGKGGTLPDGTYILEMRAGPTLELIGREEATVGIPAATDPNEFPNSDEDTILAALPADLRKENCLREENEKLFAAASAGVFCKSAGGIKVYYDLFRTRDALDDEYWTQVEQYVKGGRGTKHENGCWEGASVGEGAYERSVGAKKVDAGRVLCFRDDKDNAAVVVWKRNHPLVLGYAFADKPEPLWRWWTGKST